MNDSEIVVYPYDSRYGFTRSGRAYRLEKIRVGAKGEMNQYQDKNGYWLCNIASKTRYVHILIAETFLPNLENKPEVAHNDGKPWNNHVSNLRWATYRENVHDMAIHGTKVFGETMDRAKLTDQKVIEIRNMFEGKIPHQPPFYREAAEIYGVCEQVIWRVVAKKRWTHLA